MLLVAIILLMIAVVIVIWRFAFGSDSTSGHIKSHSKRIEGIKRVTDGTRTGLVQNKIKQTGSSEKDRGFADDDQEYDDNYYGGPNTYVQKAVKLEDSPPAGYYNSFGLPPIITVATGLAAVIIIVALVAAFILLVSPSSGSKSTNSLVPSTTVPKSKTTTSTPPTTTTLASVQPSSVSSSAVVYSAPQGKYKLNITVTKASWVEVTENPNSSKSTNVVGQTMAAGSSQSVTVTGPINLILGNTGASVTVNGVPMSFPQGSSYGTFEFR